MRAGVATRDDGGGVVEGEPTSGRHRGGVHATATRSRGPDQGHRGWAHAEVSGAQQAAARRSGRAGRCSVSPSGAEAEVVDYDEVMAQQAPDDLTDAPVQGGRRESGPGLEGRRGQGSGPSTRIHGGLAGAQVDGDGAGARGAHEHDVLGGLDPVERGEVLEGGPGHRGLGEDEVLEPAGHREARGLASSGLVGGITSRDLGLDERAQQLLGCPALDLRGS